ncbi:MAG: TetR/AcrR family transcriptional regulator [Oscillospiraceae bacterium]|nr:TetR/AcrR family transcriptional regulator [Oscillospiraceae bacterium]
MARITKSVPERRQEIIDAARALFIEKGFDKTQVSDISKRMNVAQGLVYHYFKSKTEMLYAVIDELAEEYRKTMEGILNGNNGKTVELLNIICEYRPDMDSYGELIPSICGDSAIVGYCLNKMTAASVPLLVALIERGNADGSWQCEYPEETALFILQGIGGFFERPGQRVFDTEKKQALTSIILRVLAAPAQK